MFRFKFLTLISLFLFLNISCFASEFSGYLDHNFESEDIRMKIDNVSSCASNEGDECKNITVKVIDGTLKGRVFTLKVSYLDLSQRNSSLKPGDTYFGTFEGIDSSGENLITIGEPDRTNSLWFLMALFFVLVVGFGGRQGFFAIIALFFNFLILTYVVANGVFAGFNPMLLVLLGGSLLLFFSIFLTYGFTKKAYAAFLSSIAGLFITVVLTMIFLPMTKMTGFSSEESSFLIDVLTNVSIRDVLFIGICVGTMGLLDDVTVNQSSLVFQLVSANPKMSKRQVFFRALSVGKDHLASMVNTLIVAYAGAAFPLFLLLIKDSNASLISIINMEIISEEILRMLIGSIGLILAIPISTYIATIFAKNKKFKMEVF